MNKKKVSRDSTVFAVDYFGPKEPVLLSVHSLGESAPVLYLLPELENAANAVVWEVSARHQGPILDVLRDSIPRHQLVWLNPLGEIQDRLYLSPPPDKYYLNLVIFEKGEQRRIAYCSSRGYSPSGDYTSATRLIMHIIWWDGSCCYEEDLGPYTAREKLFFDYERTLHLSHFTDDKKQLLSTWA